MCQLYELFLGVALVLFDLEQSLSSSLDDDLLEGKLCAKPMCSRLLSHLVVNICNVHDKVKLEAKVMRQDAPNDICRHIVARVSQMALVVHSRAAGVPGHLA